MLVKAFNTIFKNWGIPSNILWNTTDDPCSGFATINPELLEGFHISFDWEPYKVAMADFWSRRIVGESTKGNRKTHSTEVTVSYQKYLSSREVYPNLSETGHNLLT
ncbi:hypothetical protein V2J09_013602 [Rumex salicifolius]